MSGAQEYNSAFTGLQIDAAIERMLSTPGEGALTYANVGAAPAGYGLGESLPATVITDPDTVTAFGVYRGVFAAGGANATSNVLFVIPHDGWNGVIYQFAYPVLTASGQNTQRRGLREQGGEVIWEPWGYPNPPMMLGVEYRTTKRNGGRPVYAKCISVGSIKPDSSISVDVGLDDARDVFVDMSRSYMASDYKINRITDTNYIKGVRVEKSESSTVVIHVTSGTSSSATSQIVVCLNYTKLTD